MLMVGGVVEKKEPPDLTRTSPEWNPGFCLSLDKRLPTPNYDQLTTSSYIFLSKDPRIYSLVLGVIRHQHRSLPTPSVLCPSLLNVPRSTRSLAPVLL